MGKRERLNHPRWHHRWYSSGRYWKRKLSKARRREIKELIRSGKAKPPTHWESTVSYKNH